MPVPLSLPLQALVATIMELTLSWPNRPNPPAKASRSYRPNPPVHDSQSDWPKPPAKRHRCY